MRPDDQNILTCQYADTNNAPRESLHGLVTWNPAQTRTYSTPRICLRLRLLGWNSPLHQYPAHSLISYPTLSQASVSEISLVTVFNLIRLTIFDLIRLNWGFVWLDSILFLIWIDSLFFSIQFDSRLTYLFSSRATKFESHLIQASGIPTFTKLSLKYSNTEIVEYSTILILEIRFGENTLKNNNNQRTEGGV